MHSIPRKCETNVLFMSDAELDVLHSALTLFINVRKMSIIENDDDRKRNDRKVEDAMHLIESVGAVLSTNYWAEAEEGCLK